MVAYFCYSRKWIRAEVDECQEYSGEKILILWAVDYGLPLYTTKFEDIFSLPDEYRFPRSKIFVAGLGVMPATLRFDHVNCKVVKEFSEDWNERAVRSFEISVANALELNFIWSTTASHFEVLIGDVLIGDQSIVHYGLSSKLIEDDLAITVPGKNFFALYKQLSTNNIERWNDNRRSGGVLKAQEGVMIGTSDMADKLEKFVKPADANSTLDSDYFKTVSRKVEDWLSKAEMIDQDMEISDVGDESILDETILAKEHQEMASVSSKRIPEMFNKFSVVDFEPDSKVLKISRQTEKMIFLPAGAQMQTNNRNPKYGKVSRKESESERFSTAEISTLDDEHFVSVSQVSAAKSGSHF